MTLNDIYVCIGVAVAVVLTVVIIVIVIFVRRKKSPERKKKGPIRGTYDNITYISIYRSFK